MSGMVSMAYWRAPTTLQYKCGFEQGRLPASVSIVPEAIRDKQGLQCSILDRVSKSVRYLVCVRHNLVLLVVASMPKK
jgi:hypothetical protein